MRVVAAVLWCAVLAAVPAFAQTTTSTLVSTSTTSTSIAGATTTTATSGTSTSSTSTTSTTGTSTTRPPEPCVSDCRQVSDASKEGCRSCCSTCLDDSLEACGTDFNPDLLCEGGVDFDIDTFFEQWKLAGQKYDRCVSDPDGDPNIFANFAPSSCRRNRALSGSCYKVARRNPRRCSIVQTCVECCTQQLSRTRRSLGRRLIEASLNDASPDERPAIKKACRSVLRCVRTARQAADSCQGKCDNTPNCLADTMAACVDTVPALHNKFTKENTLAGCYATCNGKCGNNIDAFHQCRRACRDLLCDQWTTALERDTGPCANVQSACDGGIASTGGPACLLGCNDLECSELPTTTSTSTSTSVTSTSSTSTTVFAAVRRNRGR